MNNNNNNNNKFKNKFFTLRLRYVYNTSTKFIYIINYRGYWLARRGKTLKTKFSNF